MAREQHVFDPDYSVSPGAFLEESLGSMGISARELARRCGRSAKLIVEIMSGKAPLEPETALQFEKVTDVNAAIWLNIEARYRLHLARQEEDRELSDSFAWAKEFPLKEMQDRRIIDRPKNNADAVRKLLKVFGVASAEACEASFNSLSLSYRHSPSFRTDRNSLFVWLRLGELQAERIQCAPYDRATFLKSLVKIRSLTLETIEVFLPKVESLCASAGVAFVVTRPLGKMALSGLSRWLSPQKAMIQQTLRHKTNDHFWFTFFHEARHVLHGSRKTVFVDGGGLEGASAEEEEDANRWAAEFLVPSEELSRFVALGDLTEDTVVRFAEQQGVAPGIVVGQLQKREYLTFRQLNHLKEHFEWADKP
jgi:HTH-type transcriptional regulator/antitoxin HigA